MTDRTPDRTGPDVDRTTIAEAADRLGISTDAIRKRLHRGQLAGEKVGGNWVVFLPREANSSDLPPAPDRTVSSPGPDIDRTETGPDRTVSTPTDRTETVAAMRETIDVLRSEVDFLRRELETRTDELQRRDVLLREALGRIPQLTQGENASPGPVHDRSSAPQTGQGEASGSEPTSETSKASDAQRGVGRAWWQVWRR